MHTLQRRRLSRAPEGSSRFVVIEKWSPDGQILNGDSQLVMTPSLRIAGRSAPPSITFRARQRDGRYTIAINTDVSHAMKNSF